MDESKHGLLEDEYSSSFPSQEASTYSRPARQRGKRVSFLRFTYTGLLIISFTINVMLSLKLKNAQSKESIGPLSRSSYAGLLNNIDVPFFWNTPWSGDNSTEVDNLWYGNEDSDKGIIALDNSYAKALSLPDSQPWPWDAEEKSIFITNGHHNLHCLRNIYISINQYRTNKPQSLPYEHVLHCMDTLRADTICAADDTPRYTEKSGQRPGVGQNRKCRDWSKLEAWVEKHAGCFKYIKPGNKEISQIERMKYCPNDSPYLPLIRKYFGYPDSWKPWPYVEQETYKTRE